MKDQKLIKFICLTYLSYFGSGYLPKAPGTFGSLLTLPLIYLLAYLNLSFISIFIFIVILIISSTFCAEFIQNKFSTHDPGWIVIDEVIGMLITWLFIFPSTQPLDLLLVFILFRIFDIFKIFPASYFDKNIKHGFGTIFDDCISAIYAGLSLLITKFVLLHLIS